MMETLCLTMVVLASASSKQDSTELQMLLRRLTPFARRFEVMVSRKPPRLETMETQFLAMGDQILVPSSSDIRELEVPQSQHRHASKFEEMESLMEFQVIVTMETQSVGMVEAPTAKLKKATAAQKQLWAPFQYDQKSEEMGND
jgi:hypothetical protein